MATQADSLNSLSDEDHAIARAMAVLESRLRERSTVLHADAVKAFLRLQSQGLDHEVFAVAYLDSQFRLIQYERLFRGTLTHSCVHPREVAKQALLKNSAAVILHHNHPSADCQPSERDEELTYRLCEALALVDVRVLDHVITSCEGAFSMAENWMLE